MSDRAPGRLVRGPFLPVPENEILRADGIHKRYGGVHALRNASLVVRPGEVHVLVGENGSGKSTMLKILSGQVQADAGTITLRGGPFHVRNPTEALRLGIATVTQETTLAPDLSVAENVFLGHRMASRRGVIDWARTRRMAREALGRLGLDLDPGVAVRRLRPDQQQLVEIARALSIDAQVLILDEPTSSLTDDEVESLFAVIRRLRERGVAVIFVSHRLSEIFALADVVTVLRDGHTVGGGPLQAFDKPRLIELMVGHALDQTFQPADQDRDTGVPVLRVRGLSIPGLFDSIDLAIAPGEIVGLAGLVGAGRSELLEAIFGLRKAAGAIEVSGRGVEYRRPQQAVRDGVSFVPADRKRQGLVLQMSVLENLMMASTSRVRRIRPPRSGEELAVAERTISELRIHAYSPRMPVASLSGGNQQKVVLGKWLTTSPKVMMLDEPTRGVDIGAKAEIYRLLYQTAARGVGILVSSSETPELLTLCDRIIVLFRGRIVATLSRAEATEARIAHFAGGHH